MSTKRITVIKFVEYLRKDVIMKWKIFCALLTVFVVSGCNSNPNTSADTSASASKCVLNGSGATFPAPVYANWTYNYSQSQNGLVQVNYQGIGSGAGINQVKQGTVDFAGTDSPLTEQQQKEDQLIQFPMLAGGVVVVVNLPGVADQQLKLSQSVLADIFLGKIKTWNDPAIAADNKGLNLPQVAITVVHRSDSSGTSFLFTNYLSKISENWKSQVGEGKTVAWPIGIGGQKNPGVCNNVTKIVGAIGYTEYTYALEAKLACAVLQNKAGQFIAPSPEAFDKALAAADWNNAPGYYLILTDAEGEDSYPLAAVTYILYKSTLSAEKQKQLKDYFNWCFEAGKPAAEKMHYRVVNAGQKALN